MATSGWANLVSANMSAPPTGRPTGRQAGKSAMQARTAAQDAGPWGVKFECSAHAITYTMPPGTSPLCPMCEADKRIADLQAALAELRNQAKILHEQNEKMRVQVDLLGAMREAVELLNDADLMWLKATLYQWKIDKSVALKVTGTKRKGSRTRVANGFIVMPRGGDPVGYVCTSIGGMALSEYFEEATNTMGSAKAMEFLVRALAKHLPGASS